MEHFFANIVCTDGTLGGSPRLSGRRLSVGDVVSFIKNYGTLQEVMDDYELTKSEITQALQYCSNLKCKEDKPKVFCHNCSLRRDQKGPLDISNLQETITSDITFVQVDKSIFLGSIDELLENWQGQDWWTIATDLLIDLWARLFEDQNRS